MIEQQKISIQSIFIFYRVVGFVQLFSCGHCAGTVRALCGHCAGAVRALCGHCAGIAWAYRNTIAAGWIQAYALAQPTTDHAKLTMFEWRSARDIKNRRIGG